jgi:hypothetical protein
MWNDLRFGFRTLRRSPVFTIVAVLSLALGIGANTSIFSLLSQVMFRYLPVADPESLVVFHTEGQRSGRSSSDNFEAVFSYPMYRDLRDRNQVFSGVIARSSAPVSVSYNGQTERARAEMQAVEDAPSRLRLIAELATEEAEVQAYRLSSG